MPSKYKHSIIITRPHQYLRPLLKLKLGWSTKHWESTLCQRALFWHTK